MLTTTKVGQWPIDKSAPTPPRPSNFTKPLLRVLARVLDESEGELDAIDNKIVKRQILDEVGLDPDALPEGWTLKGKGKQSLHRTLMYTFRNLREGYIESSEPLALSRVRCMWSLTAAGLEQGRSLRSGYEIDLDISHMIDPIILAMGSLSKFKAEAQTLPALEGAFSSPSDLCLIPHALQRMVHSRDPEWTRRGSLLSEVDPGKSWRLTPTGLRHAMSLHGLTPLPRPRELTLPLLKVLGRLTGCNPSTEVDSQQVLLETLAEAGYQVDDLPKGWKLRGKGPRSILRKIWYAFEYKTADRMKVYEGDALTRRGARSPRGGYLWGLTKSGCAAARSVLVSKTSEWISAQGSKLLASLRRGVMKRYPASSALSLVDDHVQNWLLKVIRNDGLAKHVEKKTEKEMYTFCVWCCINQCATDFRTMGRNPVARTFTGARTRKEVVDAKKDKPIAAQVETSESEPYDLADLVDSDAHLSMGAARDWEDVLGLAFDLIEDRFPKRGAKYARAFSLKVEGYTVQEVADIMDSTKGKVGRMIQQATEALQSRSAIEAFKAEGIL